MKIGKILSIHLKTVYTLIILGTWSKGIKLNMFKLEMILKCIHWYKTLKLIKFGIYLYNSIIIILHVTLFICTNYQDFVFKTKQVKTWQTLFNRTPKIYMYI